jgi:hypothetical protein
MSIRVITQTNPFSTERKINELDDVKTVNGILRKLKINKKDIPLAISVNGVVTEDFSLKVKENDLVLVKIIPSGDRGTAISRVLGGLQVVAGIILIATGLGAGGGVALIISGTTTFFGPEIASWAENATDKDNKVKLTGPSTSDVSYLKGGKNAYGQNQPVPVILGKHRYYPYQIAYQYTNLELDAKVTPVVSNPEVVEDTLRKANGQLNQLRNRHDDYETMISDVRTKIADLYSPGGTTWVAILDTRTDLYALKSIPELNRDSHLSTAIGFFTTGAPVSEAYGSTFVSSAYNQKLHQVLLWGHKDIEILPNTLKRAETLVTNTALTDTSVVHNSLSNYGEKAQKHVAIYKVLKKFSTTTGATPYSILLPGKIKDATMVFIFGLFFAKNKDDEYLTPKIKVSWALYEVPDSGPDVLVTTKTETFSGGDVHKAEQQEPSGINLTIPVTLTTTKQYKITIQREFDDMQDEDSTVYNPHVSAFESVVALSHILCTSDLDVMTPYAKTTYNYSSVVTQDDTIDGDIDSFNAIVQTNVPNYNGVGTGSSAWNTLELTSNPASMYLYILQGAPNKRQVDDSEIDWAALEDWWQFCEDNNFECNIVLINPGSISNILKTICITGRATLNTTNNYSVLVDKERDFPTQLITNLNAFNMSLNRSFNEPVHGIYFSFIDAGEESDYQAVERAVYLDGYNENGTDGKIKATKLLSQQLLGVTSATQVGQLGKFMINAYNRRVETVSVSMDIEYLLALPGDLVKFSYDQLLTSTARGRITEIINNGSGETETILLDTDVTMEAGKSYAVVIRLANGDFVEEGATQSIPVNTIVGTFDYVILSSPQVTSVAVGDLVAFGEAATVTGDYLVQSITPSDNLSATLRLVNYAEEIYSPDPLGPWESPYGKQSDFGASPILESTYTLDAIGNLTDANAKRLDTLASPSIKRAIRTQTPSATYVREDVLEMALSNNYLYFIDKEDLSIKRTTILPNAATETIVTTPCKELAVTADDRFLLYTDMENNTQLYRKGLTSQEVVQLTSVPSKSPKFLDDFYATYINYLDGNKLYKINHMDGTENKVIIDHAVTSYGLYGNYCIWSGAVAQKTYIKQFLGVDSTTKGDVYDDTMLYNIVASSPANWFVTGYTAVAVHIVSAKLQSYVGVTPLYGDVVKHSLSDDGQYTLMNSLGQVYYVPLVDKDLTEVLETETRSEEVVIIGDFRYLSNTITNINPTDITNAVVGDKVNSSYVEDDVTITFIGSNYLVMTDYALQTVPNANIGITGTRLYLNANRVVVPGTITAGLLETNAINSIDRVASGNPNAGQQLYQHDLSNGIERQYRENGDLIRQFTPADGLWLREGIEIGGTAPGGGVVVPPTPEFTDTVNQVFRQANAPYGEGEIENDIWYDTDDGSTYAYKASVWEPTAYTLPQLDALGIDAGTVNTYSILGNVDVAVPADALFTDTLSFLYTIATGVPDTGGSNPTPESGGFKQGDVCKVTDSGSAYVYDGSAWQQTSDIAADYFANGGSAGYTGTSSWGIDSNGKLTASGADIQGNIEADSGYFKGVVEVISTDLKTRTVVDNGDISFYTRILNTDPWIPIGSLGGGYDGTVPVLIAPQDFRIGDMTIGRGKGNIDSNVALGANALDSNTSGENNVAIGRGALSDNASGTNNVGVGIHALLRNTTGDFNAVLGAFALSDNTEGYNNIAVGNSALHQNTTGHGNVAIGTDALEGNITGLDNVAIGTNALKANTNGLDNVAIGVAAMIDNTEGYFNISLGSLSLRHNTIGFDNIAIGGHALRDNTEGFANVAVGGDALLKSTGDFNTGIGHIALAEHVSGDYNIALGFGAECSTTTSSGECVLGDGNITVLRCNQQTISALSDGRDKVDVKDSLFGLDYIMSVRPVDFLWKTREGNVKDGTREVGFIAQELKAIEEKFNASHVKSVLSENPERLEASYASLIPIMVKAIQEQQKEIEELKRRIV